MFRKLIVEARLLKNDIALFKSEISHIRRRINAIAIMEKERYVTNLLSGSKYDDKRRLERHGFKVYSQQDEDGIIQEIFNRIGIESRTFVEFGVANGLENNTLKLLLEGWRGLWIEGSARLVSDVETKFKGVLDSGRLQVTCSFINRDNINGLIGEHLSGEIDLLSIDIDGNDIYILEAVIVVRPRVIIIEYNGKFPPPLSIAQEYDPNHRWSGTDYVGASLAAITKVAARKSYSLVGCGVAGVNAFFVRNDLLSDHFHAPFTAENHYQPARYFLTQLFHSGHTPDWGVYENV